MSVRDLGWCRRRWSFALFALLLTKQNACLLRPPHITPPRTFVFTVPHCYYRVARSKVQPSAPTGVPTAAAAAASDGEAVRPSTFADCPDGSSDGGKKRTWRDDSLGSGSKSQFEKVEVMDLKKQQLKVELKRVGVKYVKKDGVDVLKEKLLNALDGKTFVLIRRVYVWIKGKFCLLDADLHYDLLGEMRFRDVFLRTPDGEQVTLQPCYFGKCCINCIRG